MKKSSWNPSLCVLTLKRSRNKTRKERKLWWPAGWRGPHAAHNSLSYGHQSDRAGHLSVSLILWGFHCSCSPDFRLPPALLLSLRMRMAAAHPRRGHDRPWWIIVSPARFPSTRTYTSNPLYILPARRCSSTPFQGRLGVSHLCSLTLTLHFCFSLSLILPGSWVMALCLTISPRLCFAYCICSSLASCSVSTP